MEKVLRLEQLIGKTPILKIPTIYNNWNVYAKLEHLNPAGSFKDRTALSLIEAAEKSGKLKKGMTIYESSSGNTAKALAMLAAARGYKFVAIVDSHIPIDKLNAIRAYGAELYFCNENKKSREDHIVNIRRAKARELAEKNGGINLDQYDNPENPKGFYETLGREIIKQVPDIDYLLGTIGTGSSLSGSGRYVKEYNNDTKIIALEPQGSGHFSLKGKKYLISGPGYPAKAIPPKNIDTKLFDHHDYVSDVETFNTMRWFARNKGLLLGDSAGMLFYYAMKFIKKSLKTEQVQNMVLIIADRGENYLSHAYNDEWMIQNELIDKNVEDELRKFYI